MFVDPIAGAFGGEVIEDAERGCSGSKGAGGLTLISDKGGVVEPVELVTGISTGGS